MPMPRGVRKAVLTTHIITSVGWLGAVAAYLTLDITAVTSNDPGLVRGAHLAMDLTVWSAIVPLALASLLIGIVNALGTHWGLVRHYWVIAKLLLTAFATTILLIEAPKISRMAAQATAPGTDPRDLPGTLVHSLGGSVVLLVITLLSVYKPRGLTPHGWRRQQQTRPAPKPSTATPQQ